MTLDKAQTCRACGYVVAIWRNGEKVLELPHKAECAKPEPPPPPQRMTKEEMAHRLYEWVLVSSQLHTKSDLELGHMVQTHILNEMHSFEPKTLLLEELCDRMIERACPHLKKENYPDMVQCVDCGKIFELDIPAPVSNHPPQ
jgi:rubredoxin